MLKSVWVNEKDSQFFTIDRSLRHIWVATLNFFNSLTDYVMMRVCERDCHLADLMYADDTADLRHNLENLILTLDTLVEEAAKLSPKIYWNNTELMHLEDGENRICTISEPRTAT